MESFPVVLRWLWAKHIADPSPFFETAEPIKLKFTIPINTTPIEIKFCGKLPVGSEIVLAKNISDSSPFSKTTSRLSKSLLFTPIAAKPPEASGFAAAKLLVYIYFYLCIS